jgi:hypothetical protein
LAKKKLFLFFGILFSKNREFATGYLPKIESLPKKSLKVNKENLNAIPCHASPPHLLPSFLKLILPSSKLPLPIKISLNQSESSTYTQLDPILI